MALGELPAAIVGWCMTLEYGVSAAAVAKSWGEMVNPNELSVVCCVRLCIFCVRKLVGRKGSVRMKRLTEKRWKRSGDIASPTPPPSLVFLKLPCRQLKAGLHHAGGEDETSSHRTADGGGPDVDFEGLSPREGIEGGGGLHVFGGSLDMGGVYAALLQIACVAIVVGGLKTSTITVNTFSLAKVRLGDRSSTKQ